MSGSRDESWIQWDVKSGEKIQDYACHTSWVRCVALQAAGSRQQATSQATGNLTGDLTQDARPRRPRAKICAEYYNRTLCGTSEGT